MSDVRVSSGNPDKLGSTPDENGVNFAVFSENATKMELCLFDEKGKETDRVELNRSEDGVWNGYVEGLKAGQRYGFRADGPYEPENGHLFNPNKLLIDPYAKELDGDIQWKRDETLTENQQDSAPYMPKCVVIDPKVDADVIGKQPQIPWNKTLVYEAHPKGFTKLNEKIAPEKRGKFAGMADKEAIEHMKSIGITSIELLPIQANNTAKHLKETEGLKNYWGYDPITYFAPHPEYGTRAEFKKMVGDLHKAGMEVIMDVVYNHTGEGTTRGELGTSISFKGLDSKSYYRYQKDNPSEYDDSATGCKNSLDMNKPAALKMAVDSLRYWIQEMGVDGFRFDLATVMARDENGNYQKNSKFLEAIKKDPVVSKSKLISEPWDCAGYQVGNFPQPWREWNDKFRDDVRRFWNGEKGMQATMARRVMGSDDLLREGSNKSPSVNFITAHDGFTLHDLVAYNHKHNWDNGEQSRDGADNNNSWNRGVEGETDNPEINLRRAKDELNMMATLYLSKGIPMVVAGDEISRSQGGNNNPFSQDNKISWLNWNKTKGNKKALKQLAATSKLAKLRADHPALASDTYAKSEEVQWVKPDGSKMNDEDWNTPYAQTLSYVISGDSAEKTDKDGKKTPDDDFMVIMNSYEGEIDWKMPPAPKGGKWEVVFDSDKIARGVQDKEPSLESGAKRVVQGNSFVVLTCKEKESKEKTNEKILSAVAIKNKTTSR